MKFEPVERSPVDPDLGIFRRANVAIVVEAIGSIWVAHDLWSGFERTELLGIPLRWLRLIWIATTIVVAGLFLRNAFGARK